MKLLLTSAGLTNPTICQALTDLAGKPPEKIHLAYIPTALNTEPGDKHWTIRGLTRVKDYGASTIDIVDFSAIPQDLWQPRLEAADVLFFAGGNPYHLMDCLTRSGLADLLPELLKSRTYVGHSAGSSIMSPSLAYSSPKAYFPKGVPTDSPMPALGLVDFYCRSHLNSPAHPAATEANVRTKAKVINGTVYAIDDQSAIRVVDDRVEIVTEGTYLKI